MIYVSTGGEKFKSGYESALNYFNWGFDAVELSGGVYSEDQIISLKTLLPNLSLQVHNYFPPPKVPFVLNLASIDPKVFSQSANHIRNGIRCAIELGRPIYSFHAGFLFDPKPSDLGKQIEKKQLLIEKIITHIY